MLWTVELAALAVVEPRAPLREVVSVFLSTKQYSALELLF